MPEITVNCGMCELIVESGCALVNQSVTFALYVYIILYNRLTEII